MLSSLSFQSSAIYESEKPRRFASHRRMSEPGFASISFSKSTIFFILSRKNISICVISQISDGSTPIHISWDIA